MNTPSKNIHMGDSNLYNSTGSVSGEFIKLLDEWYYSIKNYDLMPPFFMNLVSSSDHWIFISSTGGLSAGRRNAESALFPYYTVDKITENSDNTGHVAILLVTKNNKTHRWEPFSNAYRGLYHVERTLYKNVYGNKLIFEEVNADLSMTYRYSWQTSDKYGFVKTIYLTNNSSESCTVNMLDGLQNLLPYGATTALQNGFSNLLNGYKRNELDPETGLGIYTLSSTLTDLAEPSESLKATTVWQAGFPPSRYLLSSHQLENFRLGKSITQETDIRGRRGAYLVNTQMELEGNAEHECRIIAEVNQDSSDVVSLINALKGNQNKLESQLVHDINECTTDLVTLVANADGLQMTGDNLSSTHHFSNILFNIMRGGIFVDNHQVSKTDLLEFVQVRNRKTLDSHQGFFESLPAKIGVTILLDQASTEKSSDLKRLCYEFLPLTFSRRHGDPSRPWNQFSINIKNPDGSRRLDYQGNWRDIFQNWEPLAYAYPEFVEGMLCKFLNATTADGYNPYRITGEGVEWEVPAPDDPWANIGYWSDHQIIYLQKLLEISTKVHPGKLTIMLADRIFSHANVPYRLKKYSDLLTDWYDTIVFDRELDEKIETIIEDMGTDGKLLLDDRKHVFHVNLAEKLLILLLAKLSNFVPEGGIWMNTQRPEWNDANNALVGKGLSVVTLCYLRRFISFYRDLLGSGTAKKLKLTLEAMGFLDEVQSTLDDKKVLLGSDIDDKQRRDVMDALGKAGSRYRWGIYQNGFSGEFFPVEVDGLVHFLDTAQCYVEHTILANKRSDNLYHAYNVLHLDTDRASVRHLYEMLEGQVAILSSGLLSGEQSLQLLQDLKNSSMYRADQHSYMLYPDRDLPGFLKKNTISENQIQNSRLITRLIENENPSLIIRDDNGKYHFNGSYKNARDVERTLDELELDPQYQTIVQDDRKLILDLFESVFDHNAFTGRSGTFFAFEGLGSIYWHMVSKLLLAAQEVFFQAIRNGESSKIVRALADRYYDIRQGIGFNKTPDVYGAFPTDPYSHTPAGQGAKQPGMTGQVKEECITRIGELGVFVEQGAISFNPVLLRSSEFLNESSLFEYIDVDGQKRSIELLRDSLAFTFCQVPIVYQNSSEKIIEIFYANGQYQLIDGDVLDEKSSHSILRRDGNIYQLIVHTAPNLLL